MNNYNLTNIFDQIKMANLNNLANNLIQSNSYNAPNRSIQQAARNNWRSYNQDGGTYEGRSNEYSADQRSYGGNYNDRGWNSRSQDNNNNIIPLMDLDNRQLYNNRINDNRTGLNDNRLADNDLRDSTYQRGGYSDNRYSFNDNRQNFNNNRKSYNNNSRQNYLDNPNERRPDYKDNDNCFNYTNSMDNQNYNDINKKKYDTNIVTETKNIPNYHTITRQIVNNRRFEDYDNDERCYKEHNNNKLSERQSTDSRGSNEYFSPSYTRQSDKRSLSPINSRRKNTPPTNRRYNDSPTNSRFYNSPSSSRYKDSPPTIRHHKNNSPSSRHSMESRKRHHEDVDYRPRGESSERKRSRDRSYERESHDYKDRQDVIVRVKNLPDEVQEQDLHEELSKHGLMAESVRILKRRDPGKRLTFVEFKTPNDAQHWIKRTKGEISLVPGRKSILYMDNDPSSSSSQNVEPPAVILRGDWKCSKCGCVNFKRRDKCFKCRVQKQETDCDVISEDGAYFVGIIATDTMLIRGLNMITDEARIKEALYYATKVTANDVFIVRDSKDRTSCGYGFIWLPSVEDSVKILEAIRVSHPLSIDGVTVTLNYCKTTFLSVKVFLSHKDYVISSLNDQLTSQQQHQQAQQAVSQQQQTRRLAPPDPNRYIYDEGSSFYYDPLTKLHYDSNSQYFYDSEKRLYLYWDGNNQFYVEVKSEGDNNQAVQADAAASVADVNVVDEAKKQEAEKARKLAQQMHKWAEQQNKKELKTTTSDKAGNNSVFKTPMLPMAPKKATADAGFNMLQKKMSEKRQKEADDKPNILSSLMDSYGSGSDDEEGGVVRKETLAEIEERMTDWSKKACLLCKRVFISADMLHKHKALSSLHKDNLEKYRQKLQGKVVAVEQST